MEPALRKLRNRLLAVNLTSLTLVIIVAFSFIYIASYNRTQNEIESTLSSIPPGVFENVMLSRQIVVTTGSIGLSSDSKPGHESIPLNGGPVMPVDYSKAFVVNIEYDGTITVFSMLDYENEDYAYAVSTVIENGLSSGDLNMAGRVWRYNMRQASDLPQAGAFKTYNSSIVFLDVEEATRGLRELALSLFVIGIIAIGAILLVSRSVANRAIRPVEESMARQRRFVADASHELKTPIAVIAANAEAAKAAICETGIPVTDDGSDSMGASLWLNNIADEANRMSDLVKNLLALAKAEEHQTTSVRFDLIDAIREEADRVEAFLFEKNIAFFFEPPSSHEVPLFVCSDRTKVLSVLSVLFENAVKYTPDGGRVTINAGRAYNRTKEAEKSGSDEVWVSVANTGAYIPPEDIVHVFERFFRADRSRSSETGGHGIGLSIAKEIARTIGGELTATSVPLADGGAFNTFTLFI